MPVTYQQHNIFVLLMALVCVKQLPLEIIKRIGEYHHNPWFPLLGELPRRGGFYQCCCEWVNVKDSLHRAFVSRCVWITEGADASIDLMDILCKVLKLALTETERLEFYQNKNTTKDSWYNTTYYDLSKYITSFYLGNMDIDQTDPNIVFGFEVCLIDDTTATEMMGRITRHLKKVLESDHSDL